jgi:hypothetical protein
VNNKTVQILLATVAVVALVAAGAWYQASSALHDSRSRFIGSTLDPIAALLKENQTIIKELQAEPFVEPGNGNLESYLIKIRRDGLPKNAQMKQRLDQLAENNTAIITLLGAYAPQVKTSGFTAEGDKFRKYAIAWRDRWNSLMDLYMAGGNYPSSGVPFPTGFPDAVQAEIAAAK